MPARRPAVTALTGVAVLLSLTGCQKPTPGVTAVSRGQSVHVESASYCRDGQTVEKQDCVLHLDRVAVLRVKQGALVGIDVDSELTEKGWFLYDADAKARSAVQDSHYFSYTPDFSNRPLKGLINLEVRSTDRVADDANVTGIWKIQLLQK
jgi:hypothetical protein